MNPLKNLNNIIKLFNNISENEKIYLLINYADKYLLYTPLPKEKFDLDGLKLSNEAISLKYTLYKFGPILLGPFFLKE